MTLCSHGKVGNRRRVASEQSKWGTRQSWALNLGCLEEALGTEIGLRPGPRYLLFFLSPT